MKPAAPPALEESCQSELDQLMEMAAQGQAAGAGDLEHMDGASAAFNQVRVADFVAQWVLKEAARTPVLDWGCGYGQISWLLRRRGVSVVSCDVERRPALASIPSLRSLPIDALQDPVRLPYASESFAAVLSVGVLEHVENLALSLAEVRRVLAENGALLVFMLPNRFSWAEWLADLRGISVHPRRFTFRSAQRLLAQHGFRVERRWRRHVLPRNLTGLHPSLKAAYGRHYRAIERWDRVLSRLPPPSLFSGVLELVARKVARGL